ncbi:hypothetical protein [Allorhizocola rhizosphaerae]|uniref:hypothetical protein n=1 Tax=Allorhizocola rhizosphaerae TaxID=1872709 RepID=UPI000E3CCAFC|nr:hypothetical protein [Allorhizocola rhizosphaerae]
MTDLPVYVWIIVLFGAVGVPLATAFELKGRLAVILGVVWAAWIAITIALRPLLPLAFVVGLVAALLILRRAPATPQQLAAPQRFRVVGGVFLIAMALGALPPAFALPAGLGDIAIGVLAWFAARGRLSMLWFNILGMLDLVVALTLGALLQPSTVAVAELPLLLIPATAVPLVFALHVIALRRSLA